MLNIIGYPRSSPGGVAANTDIPEIANEVHDLVVAEQRVHLGPGQPRLGLQTAHQVDDLAIAGSPVHEVSTQDQVGRAADPIQPLVRHRPVPRSTRRSSV